MRYIVLFDGVCNLCVSSVQFILKYDLKNTFLFSSLQSDYSLKLSENLNFDYTNLKTILLVDLEKNKVYNKSTAALLIATKLKFPISLMGVFFIIPKPLRDIVYLFISNNRYKWFGKKEQCYLPTPELLKRFK